MAEAQSVTTFVMGARLPWPEDAPAISECGGFDSISVHAGGKARDCSIRRISALGATLKGQIDCAPGETVSLELATGRRASATVEWAKTGELGLQFDEPLDMLALVNRKLVSQPTERRAMPRVEIRCGAYVKRGEEFLPASIVNISASGIQLQGDRLPTVGSYVLVFVNGLNIPPGEVTWRKDKLAGIELMEEISWSSIMPWIRELVRNQLH